MWRRNTIALVRAQDAAEALYPDYHPATRDKKDIFKEKHKFMYSVFDKVLQTNIGKKHVR